MTQDNWKRITFRLPHELHKSLMEGAEEHQRSVNSELVSILYDWGASSYPAEGLASNDKVAESATPEYFALSPSEMDHVKSLRVLNIKEQRAVHALIEALTKN